MNAAEIKLDMFRRIDNLPQTELEKIYDSFLALLNSKQTYKLSQDERSAVEQALEESKIGNVVSHEEVLDEAQRKYPNLRFK